MKLYFVQEAVYLKYKGNYFSPRINYETYWSRYLNHFNNIVVIARVKEVEEIPKNFHQVNGEKVFFSALPYYNGIVGFYKNRSAIQKIINKNLNREFGYVIRIPGPIGSLVSKALRKKKIRYAVEVVGDPYEVAKYLQIPKILKLGLMNFSLFQMRKIVKNSISALYVTDYTLQKRYPVRKGVLSSSASNVILQETDIIDPKDKLINRKDISERFLDSSKPVIKIGVLGMLYAIKSPLEILKSTNLLIKDGYNIELYFAGDGPLLNEVEKQAKNLSISNQVICLGNLSNGEEVLDFLESIDLYIQFSKTEGIPRAMLEAMSKGCPVISSNVGGVSEFLSSTFLVPSGNVHKLTNKIIEVLSNQEIYNTSIQQNIKTAQNYSLSVLDKKRFNHYNQVHKLFQNTN